MDAQHMQNDITLSSGDLKWKNLMELKDKLME